MTSILLVDAAEDLQPVAAALEEAAFSVATVPHDGVIEALARQAAAAVLFNMLGRREHTGVRALLRSPELPHGVGAIAVVRSEQLSSFDFSAGFDDFIVHPALPEEIVTRIRKVIWLKSGIDSDSTLRAGDLHIDLANYKAYVAMRPVELTYKEFELLRFLATNRDKVFTREALLNRVWGYDFYGGSRTVDVHIRRLRSKIEDRTHTFIETVRNVGYRFHLT